MLKSIEGNFDNPEVNELLTKHFVELRAASPEGSAHVLDIPGLKVPSIKFWSLWDDEKLIGCGALKFLDKEHGEFKSIRIHDNFRNQGQGINVINHLINEAKNESLFSKEKIIFVNQANDKITKNIEYLMSDKSHKNIILFSDILDKKSTLRNLFEKENTWLLCSNDQIVWIVGSRIDERFKLVENTQKVYLAELNDVFGE